MRTLAKALAFLSLTATILAIALIALALGRVEEEGAAAPPATASAATATVVAVAPVPVPAGCKPWPPEVFGALQRLNLPRGLCLQLIPAPDPLPPYCRHSIACYDSDVRTIWMVTNAETRVAEVYPGLKNEPAGFILIHELCHAHQHARVIDEGLTSETGVEEAVFRWLETEEGQAFLRAEQDLPERYFPYAGSPWENFANVCAAWLAPDSVLKNDWVERWQPLQAFANAWLP